MVRRKSKKTGSKVSKGKKHRVSIVKRVIRRSSKKFKRLVLCNVCILLLLLGGVSYYSGISNPLVVIKGVYLMVTDNRKIHKLSDTPLIYICNSFTDFMFQMMSEQYKVIDKPGRYFELRRDGEIITLKSEDFFGFYEIIREVDRK